VCVLQAATDWRLSSCSYATRQPTRTPSSHTLECCAGELSNAHTGHALSTHFVHSTPFVYSTALSTPFVHSPPHSPRHSCTPPHSPRHSCTLLTPWGVCALRVLHRSYSVLRVPPGKVGREYVTAGWTNRLQGCGGVLRLKQRTHPHCIICHGRHSESTVHAHTFLCPTARVEGPHSMACPLQSAH
jgi:hypothetical protein